MNIYPPVAPPQPIGASSLARSTDPDTSHAAAESQAPKLSTLQNIVLDLYTRVGEWGITDTELCVRYVAGWRDNEWPHVLFETPRKRRSDLTNLGLLTATERRRKNGHGHPEVVWVVSDRG